MGQKTKIQWVVGVGKVKGTWNQGLVPKIPLGPKFLTRPKEERGSGNGGTWNQGFGPKIPSGPEALTGPKEERGNVGKWRNLEPRTWSKNPFGTWSFDGTKGRKREQGGKGEELKTKDLVQKSLCDMKFW